MCREFNSPLNHHLDKNKAILWLFLLDKQNSKKSYTDINSQESRFNHSFTSKNDKLLEYQIFKKEEFRWYNEVTS